MKRRRVGDSLLLHGDCREVLRAMKPARVHCVVTSPPYYGLRKYTGVPDTTWGDGWRGCLGNEPTVEGYVAHMVEVFREVKRVLRDDGVCWINLGDSFAQNRGRQVPDNKHVDVGNNAGARVPDGLQSGDLLGIPWRVAFALQADGWTLREDVAWSKAAPMPESVRGWAWSRCRVKVEGGKRSERPALTVGRDAPQSDHDGHDFAPSAEWADCPGCPKCEKNDGLVLRRGSWRHTRAHEFVFMLVKSGGYYCDDYAVRLPQQSLGERHEGKSGYRDGHPSKGGIKVRALHPVGGNPRSVMHLGPEPFKGSHFAVMPTKLVEPLILAATSARGCCPACGAPWARVVEKRAGARPPDPTQRTTAHYNTAEKYGAKNGGNDGLDRLAADMRAGIGKATLGWSPTCGCDAGEPVPCTVLDPFCGSGTVCLVAARNGRFGVGIDASAEYIDLAERRLTGTKGT